MLMTHLGKGPFELQNRFKDNSGADLRKQLLAQLASWDANVRDTQQNKDDKNVRIVATSTGTILINVLFRESP